MDDDLEPELGDTVIFSADGKYGTVEAEEGEVTQVLKRFVRVKCGDNSYMVDKRNACVLRRAA